jgi:hypothetical protein
MIFSVGSMGLLTNGRGDGDSGKEEGSGLETGGGEAEEEGLDVDTQLSTSRAFLREGSDASLRDSRKVQYHCYNETPNLGLSIIFISLSN